MKAVLVTTQYRGVFFGFLESKKDNNAPASVTLKNSRNVIYWSSDCHGFMGLAAFGPTKSCKIGAKVDEIELYAITSVTPVSEKALEVWKSV